MNWVGVFNIVLVLLLIVLLRKLIWCLRWLWCYYHGKDTPGPIGWLPQRSGRQFDTRVQQGDDDDVFPKEK